MDMLNQEKKTTGHKNIEIKKIVKKEYKQITFSKRRPVLFKKASELCILCDVQIAIVVFSPGGKLFCFGHPNPKTVITRYLNGTTSEDSEPGKPRPMPSTYEGYNKRYEAAIKRLEMEEKTLEEMEFMKFLNVGEWWNDPIEEMRVDQVEQFMLCLDDLRVNLVIKANELARMKKSVL
ncbi:agamous-like MADS-box protein AGL62 [Lotus japonicus]|uniref:agamous-like MADS-box protein AGL62 n=1 Tax=Lotus japonicus TaxID=34305 RepID=UPI0025832A47|nr:agamous-like MADS-box protein AGL62 [Lotus japonicus]